MISWGCNGYYHYDWFRRSGNSGQQEVLMDLTHEGEPYQNEGAKIQRILEEALSAQFMRTIPGSLSFQTVGGIFMSFGIFSAKLERLVVRL